MSTTPDLDCLRAGALDHGIVQCHVCNGMGYQWLIHGPAQCQRCKGSGWLVRTIQPDLFSDIIYNVVLAPSRTGPPDY